VQAVGEKSKKQKMKQKETCLHIQAAAAALCV